MTDQAWAEGMAELLKSGLPGWPTDPVEAQGRSELYRRYLDDLTDEAWLHAVSASIVLGEWFPTVKRLRDLAEQYRPTFPALPRARTDQEREHDREVARHGIELIRKAAERAGLETPKQSVKLVEVQPDPSLKAVVGRDMTDQQFKDRVALLKRQAEQVATPVAEEA